MKIKGHIDIVDVMNNNKVIAHCENSFTNVGKQHICNWLLHDNYSEEVSGDGIHTLAGGESYSSFRVIPYSSFQYKRVGTHSYVENPQNAVYPNNSNLNNYMQLYSENAYWDDYPYTYNDEYGTIFYEFDKPYDLLSVVMNAVRTSSWDYNFLFEISTSPDTFVENSITPNWTRQTIDSIPYNEGSTWNIYNKCTSYRFDFYNHMNRILKNVRTVRIRSCYLDWTKSWARIYGIYFLQALPYPNTPSVISLGIGDTASNVSDTSLENESTRKFILRHKDTGNDTQVKYSMRLREIEANDILFKEVGLNFLPEAGGYIGGSNGPDVCTGLMARGVFETPWLKTEGQVVDVDYTLSITN